MTSHDLIQDLVAAVIAVIVAWLTSRVAGKKEDKSLPKMGGK